MVARKSLDYIGVFFVGVILGVSALGISFYQWQLQGVGAWTGNQNTLSPGYVEATAINSTEFYWNSANRTAIFDGDFTGIGLTSPWLDLNGVNRSTWPSGVDRYAGPTVIVGFNSTLSTVDNYYYCDGTADDVEVQAALDFVNGLGGGSVILERGTYNISQTLTIGSYTLLEGQGMENTILNSTIAEGDISYAVIKNKGYPSTTNYNIICRGFTVDGNQAGYGAMGYRGIGFRPPVGCVVEYCRVHDVTGWGISFYGHTDVSPCNNSALYNDVYNCGWDCIEFVGFENYEHVGALAHGNTLRWADGGVSFFSSWQGVISNNRIYDIDGRFRAGSINRIAIPLQGVAGTGSHECTITGNAIYTVNSTNHYHGISCLHGSHENVFSGNSVSLTNNSFQGTPFTNTQGGGRDVITGNYFRCSNSGSAIDVNIGSDNVFVGNVVTGNSWAGDQPSCVSRNIIANNLFYDSSISYGSLTVKGDDNTIRGNVFTDGPGGVNYAITLSAVADRNLIEGNSFEGMDNIDIRILAGATDNIIGHNIYRSSTVRVSDAGTNTKYPFIVLQFDNWSTGIYSSSAGEPWGPEIDDASEYAIALGSLPTMASQLMQIRVIAVSNVTEADYMTLEITGEGSAMNTSFTTESIDIATLNSTTGNFAADEHIEWIATASNDADIDDILGGYGIQIKIIYEAASGGACATDAIFKCIILEYI